MTSFIGKMGHQLPPEEPQRPLLSIMPQDHSDEILVANIPKTLNESRAARVRRLIPQFLILTIPACFIVLGACIAMIHRNAESKVEQAIMQAIKVSATLWPIAFAAVVGPMVKAIALHSAEKGTSLGTLEVVLASQTLVSTLRGFFTFRIMSLQTLAITAIWTLSPAGGQSISRAVAFQKSSSEIALQSFPTNNFSDSIDVFNLGISSAPVLYSQWSGIASTAFLGPDTGLMHSNGSSNNFRQAVVQAGGDLLAINSSRSDLWKNVRIPILHLLPGYRTDRPSDWVDIPLDTIPPYESLIGIPIRGMTSDSAGNGTTIISSYYHYFSCEAWVNQTEWLLENPNSLLSIPIVNGSINATKSIRNSGFPNIFMDLYNDTRRQDFTEAHPFTEPNDKQVLVFGNGRRFQSGNITSCKITTSYVDSKVDCTRTSDGGQLSCAAKAVRHTKDRPVSGNLTAFDRGLTWKMFNEIPFILASMRSGSPTPGILEMFLKDPPSTFNSSSYGPEQWYYGDLPLDIFSARLSMLINTFHRASLDMPSLVGMKSMTWDNDTRWMDTKATWKSFTAHVYVVQAPWFILYIFSTIVMTLCALANIILRDITRAPDFLGSVSALTRDSPFVDTPAGGSVMDGTERAKLLRDKWVRIQDVKPDEDVGRIAFSDAKGSGRLRVDRQYE